jgi:hypothetical protein
MSRVFSDLSLRRRLTRLLVNCAALTCFAAIAIFASNLCVAAPPAKPLDIYFVDVEGGQSTLFVTPEGKSLLIDTGWRCRPHRCCSKESKSLEN